MKKSLVLAMAMAMGVTASAYAANPFADVPAGHWAYDSVSQLAAAGVVEGYGDGFGGDKLMTRYEMAQVVAKAMAKGGNCDKLAAEFADELDALGVRVAKLEKKVDNVKITGNIRYSYAENHYGAKANHDNNINRFRSRLFVEGAINKNWKYTGMLENNRQMNGGKKEDITLNRAFLNGRLGGLKVEAGRCYFCQSDVTDERGDGVKVSYKVGKVNLTGWVVKNYAGCDTVGATSDASEYNMGADSDRLYMVKADTKLGKLGAFVQYWKLDASDVTEGTSATKAALNGKDEGTEIFEVGVTYPVAKGLTFNAQYYHGSADGEADYGDANGWEAGLKYLGAKAAKPGTWGLWFTYSDRPVATFIHPSCLTTYGYKDSKWWNTEDGYKGFEFGANYAFAKNIVGTARYLDYKGREGTERRLDTVWAEVVFTF